jgi:high affinity sulfate transporter 1
MVVTALVVPQALGYAAIAGVPVQVGLYAVPLALVAYAVLGSSPNLVVGPASTVAVVSGSLVAGLANGDQERAVALTAAIAIVAGLALSTAGLLRVGWLAEFLSKSIVTGFVFGLALTIVVGEIHVLLGFPGIGDTALVRAYHTILDLGQTDETTVFVSVVALIVLFGGGKIFPRLPWSFVVVVSGIAISNALDLSDHGVAVVGDVPGGLPSLGLPGIPLADFGPIISAGALVALVAAAEGLSAARTFSLRDNYEVDSNQELLGAGVANVAAGLSGGLAVAGSLSKTAAAERAGSRTQVTGLIAATLVGVVLVFLTGSLSDLPLAVLSAVVINAVWGLMDVAAIRRYRRIRRADFIAAMVGLIGVIVAGPFYGLVAAVGLSLLAIVYRSARLDIDVMGKIDGEKAAWGSVSRHPERRTFRGVLVLRADAPLFWANAAHLKEIVMSEVHASDDLRAVVLDLESTNQLDVTSVDMLTELLFDLRDEGIELYLVRVFHRVREVLKSAGFIELIGDDHMWHSMTAGVRAARAQAKRERNDPRESAEIDDLDTYNAGEERIAVGLDPHLGLPNGGREY